MTKTFTPKPFDVGAPVTWWHVPASGPEVVRTGVIWSKAPLIKGTDAAWVVPTVPDPADPYPMVVVAKPGKRGHWTSTGRRRTEGQLYSEADSYSDTGSLAHGAATWTARNAARDYALTR